MERYKSIFNKSGTLKESINHKISKEIESNISFAGDKLRYTSKDFYDTVVDGIIQGLYSCVQNGSSISTKINPDIEIDLEFQKVLKKLLKELAYFRFLSER